MHQAGQPSQCYLHFCPDCLDCQRDLLAPTNENTVFNLNKRLFNSKKKLLERRVVREGRADLVDHMDTNDICHQQLVERLGSFQIILELPVLQHLQGC